MTHPDSYCGPFALREEAGDYWIEDARGVPLTHSEIVECLNRSHGPKDEGYFDVVFDGPPIHESGRFIEVENAARASIKVGEWLQRDDGYWVLRIKRCYATGDESTWHRAP